MKTTKYSGNLPNDQSMLLLLRLNDISLSYTQQELIKIMLDIAAGRKNDQDLRKWIDKHHVD